MRTISFAQWLSAQFFKNLGHAVYKNLGQTRTPHAVSKTKERNTSLVKHSSSFIPVKVLPSPLGAMVLYCYHTATYYSANLYRVVDLRADQTQKITKLKKIGKFNFASIVYLNISTFNPKKIHCETSSSVVQNCI